MTAPDGPGHPSTPRSDQLRDVRVGLVLGATTGGIGAHVAALVPRLTERRNSVRIWCPSAVAAGPLAGVAVPTLPLARLPLARSADVIHAHGYKAAALAAPIAVLTRTPMISSWHNDIPAGGAQRVIGRMLRMISARASTMVLGVSSDLVDAAERLGADARLAPVPAAPLRRPDHDRQQVRRSLGLGPDDVVIICVARLAPQKNLGMVLDIAARTGSGPGRPTYLVVGEGPERAGLERRIRTDGLAVRLLGHRDDVADLLGAADLALNTSRWEGSSLAVQETLQAGVGLIITDVGGNRDLVGDGAVLVEAGRADRAAAEIVRLRGDPAALRALRERALRQAASWPDEDAVADDLDRLYRSVARRR
jgi:glycosyltransferase involved in cell wall biosynthesis